MIWNVSVAAFDLAGSILRTVFTDHPRPVTLVGVVVKVVQTKIVVHVQERAVVELFKSTVLMIETSWTD
jgi:hypothetical protein